MPSKGPKNPTDLLRKYFKNPKRFPSIQETPLKCTQKPNDPINPKKILNPVQLIVYLTG